MRNNKLLLLFGSFLSLALLVVAAAEENVFREWRRVQSTAKGPGGPVETRLRQVVVPALGVTDRCVTCHVGMSAGEPNVPGNSALAAHPPIPHDPASYGCTTCHSGQGRATEKADAHGTVPHWPEPMIPKVNADAGCGTCHSHIEVPNTKALRSGQAAFERYDCLSCHKVDGRGGTLRPGGGGMEGPDLSRIGAAGYEADWYEKHLEKSRTAGGPWTSAFGTIPDAERGDLETFLRTRVGAPKLVLAKALFHSLGCRGCHKIAGVGGDDGPELTAAGQRDPALSDFTHVPGERTLSNWWAEHFRNPSGVVPGSQMPAMVESEDDIQLLTHYVLSLRRGKFPEAFWPRDRIRAERFGEREFATDGATLYTTFCAACHGPAGEGMRYAGLPVFPAIGNPDFLELATDEMIAATVRSGRPGRRMPAWGEKAGGLRPEEVAAVVAHVRSLSPVRPQPDGKPRVWARPDAAHGPSVYARACASCHGDKGQGGEGPALANKVLLGSASDTYLFETIRRGRRGTSMEAFSRPSTTRPALSDSEIESVVAFVRGFEKGEKK